MTATNTQSNNNGSHDWARVKQAVDLVEYMTHTSESHAKVAGDSVRIEPCPICTHGECCTVAPAKQLFKCFSCDAAGDVFTYHERYFSTSKADALKAVATYAGVALSAPKAQQGSRANSAPASPKADDSAQSSNAHGNEPSKPPQQTPINQRQQQLFEAAARYYQDTLASQPEFVAVLTEPKDQGGRGHEVNTIKRLEMGFSDGKLHHHLKKLGFTQAEVCSSGLYTPRKQKAGDTSEQQWADFFTPNLFIFPHRTETGEIGHFTLKDPEKDREKRKAYQFKTVHRLPGLLFGNQRAINGDQIIICEGENDLASFIDVGITNVLATMGQLSTKQIQWLLKHASGKQFVLMFDNDNKPGSNGQPPAGIKYTRKLYMHLLRQPDCEVLVASGSMAPGQDPDDYIHSDKPTAAKRVRNALQGAENPLTWELKQIPADMKSNTGGVLNHLKEIEFFDSMIYIEELMRDAIISDLVQFGFTRDAVMASIENGYNLRESLEDFKKEAGATSKPDEPYMREVARRVWNWFNDRGKYFVTEEERLCLFYKQVIYEISGNQPWYTLINKEAGLNETQPTTKYVMAEVKAKCYDRGERLGSFTWVHYSENDGQPTLYMNLNDPANRIMTVTGGKVDLVENGTNADQVLLAKSQQLQPFRYNPEVDVAAAMVELKDLVFDSMSCPMVQRYLVLSWTLSAFCMPLSQAKALMKMEGGSASGKTTAAKYCSLLLYGQNIVGRMTGASAYSMGASEPMLVMDNMETENLNKNMGEFLLLAATGATNFKRQGGTDKGVTSERANCLVAVTAIEPFTKPELINRTLQVDFDKKYRRSGFIDEAMSAKLVDRRDTILSAWVKVLSSEVIGQLDERERLLEYIQSSHPDSSKDRLNGYMSMLALIGKALLKYIPLDKDLHGSKRPDHALIDEWITIQDAQARETEQGTNQALQFLDSFRRSFLLNFAAQKDAVPNDEGEFVFLDTLLGVQIAKVPTKDMAIFKYRIEVSTSGLLDIFQRHAKERGVRVPWKSARELGARINNERDTLSASGWTIKHSKKVKGERFSFITWSPEGE